LKSEATVSPFYADTKGVQGCSIVATILKLNRFVADRPGSKPLRPSPAPLTFSALAGVWRTKPVRNNFGGARMDARVDEAGIPVFLSSDRLASLSDTMFGVAMTLVATTLLPSVEAHKGSIFDMLRDMNAEFLSVVLSFAISARYWVSQQQRLAMTASVTPRQTWLHLIFLFLIVLVPISTSLGGLAGSGAIRDSVMIYGAHLTLIALVNLLLWIEVRRGAVAHLQIVRSSLALALFVVALAVGAMRPDLALYLWIAVLATPLLSRPLARRFLRT
jgi:uncharacterized membrane protein